MGTIEELLRQLRGHHVLSAKYNQKFIDALHYATAIRTGCHAIITNDKEIRTSEHLEVIPLSTYRTITRRP